MILPYVYRLTHKESGQFYIGYREANKVKAELDLPEYRTSSTRIHEMGFDSFHWEIVAEFFDAESAYRFENRLIEEYINDPLCLNGHYVKDDAVYFTMTGKSHDDNTKKAISESLKGKPKSEEHLRKMTEARRNSPRYSEADMRSVGMTGKTHSEETKRKIAEAKLGKKRGPYNKRQGK